MRVLHTIQPVSPKSNQPTIPVILRGKKKHITKNTYTQSQRKYQPQVLFPIGNPTSIFTIQNIPNPPQTIINRSIKHIRSISVPHVTRIIHPPPIIIQTRPNITINRPLQMQKVVRKPPNNFKNIQKDHVRKCLDQSLNKIYGILNQKRLSLDLKNIKQKNVELTAPRLQNNLVQQYIQLIYRDYQIPDPYSNPNSFKNINSNQNSYIQQLIATEPNNRRYSKKRESILSGSTNKKAVQLKQSFLVEMFSPAQNQSSASNKKHIPQKSNLKNLRQVEQSHLLRPFLQKGNLAQISQNSEKQIKQVYRFCFICQQPILEANIDLHEHEKCPQFSDLYQMNLTQIRQTLIRKILRIKKQIEQIHGQIFNDENENSAKKKLDLLQKQSRSYLKSIDINICEQKRQQKSCIKWKGDLKFNFSSVMRCYEQKYFKMYENLRKLHWFTLMFKNLQEKYAKNPKNINQEKQDYIKKDNRQTQQIENRRFSLPN